MTKKTATPPETHSKATAKAAPRETKIDKVIKLLKRKDGATLDPAFFGLHDNAKAV